MGVLEPEAAGDAVGRDLLLLGRVLPLLLLLVLVLRLPVLADRLAAAGLDAPPEGAPKSASRFDEVFFL